jgi:hypothetical protein
MCPGNGSSFQTFVVIRPHPDDLGLTKHPLAPDAFTASSEIRFFGRYPARGQRREERDGFSALLDLDLFALGQPRLEFGEVIAEITHGHDFHLDTVCAHERSVNFRVSEAGAQLPAILAESDWPILPRPGIIGPT